MIPAHVLPDDEQIIGPPDGWAFKLLLDPAKNWAGSTFTADAATLDEQALTIALDQTHKADTIPYVVLSLTSDQLIAIGAWNSFHWNLAESPILNRTFATQTVRLTAR